MDYQELKKHVTDVIKANKDEYFELNKWIFDKKELSGEEYETSAKMVQLLKDKGFTVEYPYAGFDTAYFAAFPTGRTHKRKIAILTEYDALPEVGHACGHCLSGSISLLAGLALSGLQDELDADINIIGTPAEETDGAKTYMADAGIFDDYDMAIMVHMSNYNMVEPDVKGLISYDYFFHGKAAHAGSTPWEGRNALNAGQLFMHAIDMMRQHIMPDCRVHGIFKRGGDAENIVPDEVSLGMYMRSLDLDRLNDLVRRVDLCAEGAAIATECTWEKKQTAQLYMPLKKNPAGRRVLEEVYEELGLPLDAPDRSFGSTDAANVSWKCPTFHPMLETVPHEIVNHQREFADYMTTPRAYDSLSDGAMIICLHCIKILTNDEIFRQMKEDFSRK
ncbi:MAG: M20 family metallopeptidase [Firmicutes bacterium]|nr:M20 family metallopeptidase [Bacillota bacterium]